MFGIAWGVFSLLLLVGLGEGFRSGNKKQFDTLGENVMFLWSGRAPAVQGSFTALRQYYLTYRDYLDILRECRSVGAAVSRNQAQRYSRGQRFLSGEWADFWCAGYIRPDPVPADSEWALAECHG